MSLLERVHGIRDEALGNTSYLVLLDGSTAVSIDPPRDAASHLVIANRLGVRIAAVLETHLHADFVSGAREVAHVTGAEVFAAAEAGLAFPHAGLADGSRFSVGGAEVEVIGTPGHTPEHIGFLVALGSDRALFSGGSLIVGGAARTDLSGASRTAELSRAQFASLQRLRLLPDDVAVFPTHGAGSFCSTGPARSASSTIGDERRSNPLFSISDEREFVARMQAGFGSYPRYFAHLREVNRAGAPLLSSYPPVARIEPEQGADIVRRGAWLVDGRDVEDWSRAHPAGAVSIQVRPSFASWLGWVVPFGAPVVLVLDPPQVDDAVRLARGIGYDRLEGWTTFEAWRDAGLPVATVESLTPTAAAERAANGAALLDVRQASEWDAGRIPGAVHIEAGEVAAGKTPEATEVIAYCGSGQRSATAASLLERRGLRVANLRGGIHAWRRAGLAVES